MSSTVRNGIILAIVTILALWGIVPYNTLVASANNVRNQWANLESAYQRRLDLVNQTMPSVIGGAEQELAVFQTLRDQAAALSGMFNRDEVGQAVVPTDLEIERMNNQIASFDRTLISAISFVADNPDINSTQLFSNFMVEVEGSENRINVARRDYNATVTSYRNSVQVFPNSILAGVFGYTADQFPYFQAQEGADRAPDVEFPTPVR